MKQLKFIRSQFEQLNKNPETRSLLLGGGALLLAYFGIVRPILKKVGILKSDRAKAEEAKQQQDLELNEDYRKQLASVKPSFPPVKYAEIANIIYDAIGSYSANDNEDKVYAQFGLLQNDRDLAELRKAFGLRDRRFWGMGISKMDLGTMLNNALSDSEIDKVNQILQSKNINYKF